MRFFAINTLFAFLLAFTTSCDKQEDSKSTLTKDYLPLEVGNYWSLEYLEKREVVGTKMIHNKMYFELQYMGGSSYYRCEDDKIFMIDMEGNETVKFDLSANVSDSWNFDSFNVKLISKTDTILIKEIVITNCYQFYLDIPVMVDEERGIWLAPGIGFIQEQCGECLHQTKKLKQAQISKQVLDFN